MSYYRIKARKDGSQFAEIEISRPNGQRPVYKRLDIKDSWSKKTIESKVNAYVAEIKRQGNADGLLTKAEQTEKALAVEKERQAMPTVKAYAEDFIKVKTRERSANTVQYYSFILDGHILPVLGSYKLDEVLPKDIKKLLTDMQANGFSHSTVRGCYITLNQLFNSAYIDEIINRNPVKKEYAPKKSKDDATKEPDKAYTIQEIQRLRECLVKDYTESKNAAIKSGKPKDITTARQCLKWQCIVNLLICTGCRRAEISALRWNKIDWQTGAILIDANIIDVKGLDGKYQLKQVSPKSGKARIVYVDDDMLNMLNMYASELGAITQTGYIFTQEKDTALPITPHAITRYLSKFGKKHGFENLHPHALRHSFATAGILNGVDVVSMSKLLGHSDPSITLNTYSHANETANRLASQKTLLALKGITDDSNGKPDDDVNGDK